MREGSKHILNKWILIDSIDSPHQGMYMYWETFRGLPKSKTDIGGREAFWCRAEVLESQI